MASSKKGKTMRPAGITHHPLEQEQGRQKQVPPRGKAKDPSKSPPKAGSARGHRLSRQEGPQGATSATEAHFEGIGGKGGKTGGSRAGLLASRKGPKGRR
jgi:hypothetical protein